MAPRAALTTAEGGEFLGIGAMRLGIGAMRLGERPQPGSAALLPVPHLGIQSRVEPGVLGPQRERERTKAG